MIPWWLAAIVGLGGVMFGAMLMALLAAADGHRIIDEQETPGWVSQLWVAMAEVPDGVALNVRCAHCLRPVRYWYDPERDPHPGQLGGWQHGDGAVNFDHVPQPYIEAVRNVDEARPL